MDPGDGDGDSEVAVYLDNVVVVDPCDGDGNFDDVVDIGDDVADPGNAADSYDVDDGADIDNVHVVADSDEVYVGVGIGGGADV